MTQIKSLSSLLLQRNNDGRQPLVLSEMSIKPSVRKRNESHSMAGHTHYTFEKVIPCASNDGG